MCALCGVADCLTEKRAVWRGAIDDWLDEVEMLMSDEPDEEAVEVMTEELFDDAPVMVLLIELHGWNDGMGY